MGQMSKLKIIIFDDIKYIELNIRIKIVKIGGTNFKRSDISKNGLNI